MCVKPEDEISYGYLNLDKKRFFPTLTELTESVGKGGVVRAIPNYNHGQVLYAAATNIFSQSFAIITCRRLTGVTN